MKGDKKVIEQLNEALYLELGAVNQYWLHYRLLEDMGVTKFAKKEREESIEIRRVETAEQHRFLQTLIDAIPDGIRVIGPDFRIHRANAAYAAQTGRPLTDIVGQFCYASSHGRDTPCPYTLVTCPVVEPVRT